MPDYKRRQRDAEKEYKNRGRVIHVSCYLFEDKLGQVWKRTVDGTYRCRHLSNRPRGKAAIKAAKRLSHRHHHYRIHRAWAANVKAVESSLGMKLVN